MPPKRIGLIFNHSFFLGGGEISFYELIKFLDKKKYEPFVFTPAPGEIEKKLRSQKYSVFVCAFPPLKKIVSLKPVFALFRIIKLFKQNNIQIIHVNGSRACFYCGLAGRILGLPVVWHVRETKKDFLFYEYFLILISKVIICVSKGVEKKRFGRFDKWMKGKIKIVYNGVNTVKFRCKKNERQRVRRDLGIDNQILFGIIGNIIPLKGQDFFLRGLARAKEQKPDLNAKILIIGRSIDSLYEREVQELVVKLNLNDDVIFMNYSEKIIEIFSALDIFALPSRREGFSRSLLEAMSFGLPVLATKLSEIQEAVPTEENAILVKYDDVNGLSDAIIKLYKDEKLRMKLGGRNRDRVVGEFNLLTNAKATENIYDHL